MKSTGHQTSSLCLLIFRFEMLGVSANADPRTDKLRTRVTHIWGDRKRQPDRSAMEGPQPGGTALMITVSPVPGKYAYVRLYPLYIAAQVYL